VPTLMPCLLTVSLILFGNTHTNTTKYSDNLGEEGAGAANTAAVTIVPAEQPVPAVVAVPLAPPVAAAAPAAPAPVAGAAGAPNPPPVPPPQGIGAGPNGGPPANVNVPCE
jgi:hypothetical protein